MRQIGVVSTPKALFRTPIESSVNPALRLNVEAEQLRGSTSRRHLFSALTRHVMQWQKITCTTLRVCVLDTYRTSSLDNLLRALRLSPV